MYAQVEKIGYRNQSRRKGKKRRRRNYIFLLLLAVLVPLICFWRFVVNVSSSKQAKGVGSYAEIDISGEIFKGEIPLFLQTDARWGQCQYGDGTMAENGCGPTCLSMVYSGLTGDGRWNPYELAKKAEKAGYYVAGSGTSWSMMTELAEELGLTIIEVKYEEEKIRAELQRGNKIICIMGPGDFTTTGHFIVLAGVKEDGSIILRDPNSRENSEKSWELQQLMPQIRNLWGYQYICR